MIPYADLERAITRWKNRTTGADSSAATTPAPEPEGTEVEAEAYAEVVSESSSGVIQLGDVDPEETM